MLQEACHAPESPSRRVIASRERGMRVAYAGLMTINVDMQRVTTDGEVLWGIKKVLDERFPALGLELEHLRAQCSDEDQRHITTHPEYDHGTTERWAWHTGYVACLGSIVHLIDQQLAALYIQRRKDREP